MSGTDIVHVPHKASGDARNSILGGRLGVMFSAIDDVGSAEAGKVVALATRRGLRADTRRAAVAEAGVPGYEAVIWLGIMAPKGTPDEIVQLLNREINKVIDDPAVRGAWAKQGAVPMHMTVAEFDAYLRKDIEKWGAVVKSAGITPR